MSNAAVSCSLIQRPSLIEDKDQVQVKAVEEGFPVANDNECSLVAEKGVDESAGSTFVGAPVRSIEHKQFRRRSCEQEPYQGNTETLLRRDAAGTAIDVVRADEESGKLTPEHVPGDLPSDGLDVYQRGPVLIEPTRSVNSRPPAFFKWAGPTPDKGLQDRCLANALVLQLRLFLCLPFAVVVFTGPVSRPTSSPPHPLTELVGKRGQMRSPAKKFCTPCWLTRRSPVPSNY